VYSYWRVSPLEFVIWLAAVLVTIFSSIENGIYTSIASSGALLLIRIAHPRGYFLGKVTLREDNSHSKESREVFVPLTGGGTIASDLKVIPPSPGVIVYRFEESYLYPNSSLVNSALVDHVKENMRRGKDMSNVKASDRPWNDPGPRRRGAESEQAANDSRPVLHAIVLDFSVVWVLFRGRHSFSVAKWSPRSHIDTTAVQALIDTRTEIEKWTDHPIEVSRNPPIYKTSF